MSSGGVVTASLEDLTAELSSLILSGGVVIWYHNHLQRFTYVCKDDKEMWREVWDDLKRQVSEGVITAVKSDDRMVLQASGPDRVMFTPLYPMLVSFKQVPCPAYFLLKQSGDSNLIDYTPYFFKNKKTRDDAVSVLSSSLVASTQEGN